MVITPDTIRRAWPRCPGGRVSSIVDAISDAVILADLTTVDRLAAFLGQCGWECYQGRALVEGIDQAMAYEGRVDLCNTEPGDGVRYRGRGFIHLTGRHNYRAAGMALGLPLDGQPEMVEDVTVAAQVASWYWADRDLNAIVDAGEWRDLTAAINGAATDGPPSYHPRRMHYVERARSAITL